MRRILLFGPPRSGSTWLSEVLAAVPGAARFHEPDSDPHRPFALVAKAGIGRYPILAAGDDAEPYRRLWVAALQESAATSTSVKHLLAKRVLRSTSLDTRNEILHGTMGRRSHLTLNTLQRLASPESPPPAEILIVKSVHSPASAGFVAGVSDASVVVVRRNPLNTVASWLDLGWRRQRIGGTPAEEQRLGEVVGAQPPADEAPLIEHHAWTFSALTRLLDMEAERQSTWTIVQHEELCQQPEAGFRDLLERLDVGGSATVVSALERHEAPASGYTTKRIAAEQPDRWRSRLEPSQVETVRRVANSLSIDC